MAEFLIKAIDSVHSDITKDKCGCYKRGDVVVVKPDGWTWGKEENPKTSSHKKFVILKIEGMSVLQAEKYLKPETKTITTPDGLEEEVVTRRKYSVLLDDFSQNIKTEMEKDVSTITYIEFEGKTKDKITYTKE